MYSGEKTVSQSTSFANFQSSIKDFLCVCGRERMTEDGKVWNPFHVGSYRSAQLWLRKRK